MLRYILHIGRHKTGTSSLQRFLRQNRDTLAAAGYYYPQTGLKGSAHYYLAACAARRQRSGKAEATLGELRAELAGREGTVVVSSEGFQAADPAAVARIFPPQQTRVVVYVREPIGYTVSAYQQRVHARPHTGSIDEFARNLTWRYAKFFEGWEAAYGRERLAVSIYDRSRLHGGDIVKDFLLRAGIPQDLPYQRLQDEANPSIGGRLLALKLRINSWGIEQSALAKALYGAFETLAREHEDYRVKPRLSDETVELLEERYRDDLALISAHYFGGVPAFPAFRQAASAPLEPAGAQDFDTLLRRLTRAKPRAAEFLIARMLQRLDAGAAPAPDRLKELRKLFKEEGTSAATLEFIRAHEAIAPPPGPLPFAGPAPSIRQDMEPADKAAKEQKPAIFVKAPQLADDLRKSDPAVFGQIPASTLVRVIEHVYGQINARLDEIDEGMVRVPGLGHFSVRTVDKEVGGKSALVKRIGYRKAGDPSAREGAGRAKKNRPD